MHEVIAVTVAVVRDHGTDVLSAVLAVGSNPNVVAILEFLGTLGRAIHRHPKEII